MPDGCYKPREDSRHNVIMSGRIWGNGLCPCFSLSSTGSTSQLSFASPTVPRTPFVVNKYLWIMYSSRHTGLSIFRSSQQPSLKVCLLKALFDSDVNLHLITSSLDNSLWWLLMWSEHSVIQQIFIDSLVGAKKVPGTSKADSPPPVSR